MGSRRGGGQRESELSERQRYWLKHLRAAEGKGEALSEYADRLGLSKHSLYEAKRKLRELGVITAVSARGTSAARFARVAVSGTPLTGGAALQVRLASGAVLEWSDAPRGDALRELVGLLTG